MHNSQEKAELSPPRRQKADLPPLAPKISLNPIRRTWQQRTSAVTFSPYPVRSCEKIGGKRQNTKWAIDHQRLTKANFGRFQFFHTSSVTAGAACAGPRAQQPTNLERLWNSDAPCPSWIAAPEDGRTPLPPVSRNTPSAKRLAGALEFCDGNLDVVSSSRPARVSGKKQSRCRNT